MKYTFSKWFCRECSRNNPEVEGFGCESKFSESGMDEYTCEKCGRKTYSLYRYRVPEKDIRFKFVSSYRQWASWNVIIDGKFLTYPDSDGLVRLEYTADKPFAHDLKLAIEEGWNVSNEEDLYLNWGAWGNTIHYEYSDMLVSDDILAAFQIYADKVVKRAVYRCEWNKHGSEKVQDWEQISRRVEFY